MTLIGKNAPNVALAGTFKPTAAVGQTAFTIRQMRFAPAHPTLTQSPNTSLVATRATNQPERAAHADSTYTPQTQFEPSDHMKKTEALNSMLREKVDMAAIEADFSSAAFSEDIEIDYSALADYPQKLDFIAGYGQLFNLNTAGGWQFLIDSVVNNDADALNALAKALENRPEQASPHEQTAQSGFKNISIQPVQFNINTVATYYEGDRINLLQLAALVENKEVMGALIQMGATPLSESDSEKQ